MEHHTGSQNPWETTQERWKAKVLVDHINSVYQGIAARTFDLTELERNQFLLASLKQPPQ